MRRLERIDHDRMDEAELVALARAGDRDAFRIIMQRGNQRLFRIARGVMRDDSEAEDVLQEAYVRAFAAIGGFRGEAGIMTWLSSIVLNEARGRLRRRRPMVPLDRIEQAQETGCDIIAFPQPSGVPSPEADVARVQIRGLIEQAVDALPEPFRVVFILRDIEGCTVEETATALGLKAATVKTRLHRARRLLRQVLDEKLAATLVGAFPFLGARCQRITDRVLDRMAAEGRFSGAPGTSTGR